MHDHYRYSVALGLAQAMLAGPLHHAGLAARLRAATGQGGSWIDAVGAEASPTPARCRGLCSAPTRWPSACCRAGVYRLRLSAPTCLACVRYFLRPGKQLPPPLGLDEIRLPALATVGDLALWLGIDTATLGWFTDAPARRRHAALQQQHYQCRWWPKQEGVRVLEVPRARLKGLQRRLHR